MNTPQTTIKMKTLINKFLLSIASFLLCDVSLNAQWNTLHHDATVNRTINDIFFVGSTGYAVGMRADAVTWGSRGQFYKTTDGGVTWTQNSLPLVVGTDSIMSLKSAHFITPSKGYAVAACYTTNGVGGFYYGSLLQTTDGGATWTTNFSTKSLVNYATGNTTDLHHVYFSSTYSAVLCGRKRTSSSNYDGVTYYTNNGGNNWYQTIAFNGSQANASDFQSTSTGSVVGGKLMSLAGPYDGRIAKTTDGGGTYTTTYTDPAYAYVDVNFPTSQIGYAIGDSMYFTMPGDCNGKLVKTTNGGNSWSTQAMFTNIMPLTVYFTDALTGYIGGETGPGDAGILKTTDGGATWTPAVYPDIAGASHIACITFSTPVTGYASNSFTSSNSIYGSFTQSCGVFCGNDTTFCQTQGQLFATPATPGSNYTFSWSPATGLSDPNEQNPLVSYVYNQQYVVTMTDTVTMCVATDTIVVTAYNWFVGNVYVCPPDSALLDFGPGASSYFWQTFTDTNNVASSINVNTQTYWASEPGTYLGFAIFPGCGALTSLFTLVDSCTSFACGVNAGPDTTFCQLHGQLFATPASPGNYTFTWSPSTGLDNPNAQNPNVIAGVNNQQYVVTMIDAAQGCTATDTVVVSAYYWAIDTAYSCNNQPVTFDLGPGATQYTVQFTDTAGNFQFYQLPNEFLVATQPAQYLCIAFFPGCGALTSLLTVIDSCNVPVGNVWPGDCNYDLSANMADALHIGLGYGATGATRPGATPLWYAQPMADWTQNFANCNYKHADANGDGTINVNDTLPISLNYGQTHPYRLSPPVVPATAPELYLVANYDTVGLQTLVTVDIRLGTAALPIDSLYGISFRITSDALLIDTNLTLIDPTTTWLGNTGNSFNFRKYFRNTATVDVAECRKDHNNFLNGNGTIGTFYIVTTDNLSGIAICHLNITDVTAVTESQHYLLFNTVNDSVVIDPSHPASVQEFSVSNFEFGVYPNPANEVVNIQTTTIADEITITDMLGQIVMTVTPNSKTTSINTSSFATGVYFVSTKKGDTVNTQKLNIAR